MLNFLEIKLKEVVFFHFENKNIYKNYSYEIIETV